jgi:hypothetical protein
MKSLLIATGVFFVASLIAFIVLSFPSFFSPLFPKPNSNTQKIKIVSDIPAIRVSPANINELNTILDTIGFFQGAIRVNPPDKKISHLQIPTIFTPQYVVIHLTDIKQPLGQSAARDLSANVCPLSEMHPTDDGWRITKIKRARRF